MTSKIKKTVASFLAIATFVIGSSGISANAYNESANMVLRNVSGAPGNVLNGTLTINRNNNDSYYTSYGYIYNNSFYLNVRSTNALSNNKNKTLTKTNSAGSISVVAKYNYITFSGSLSSTNNQSGTWYIS